MKGYRIYFDTNDMIFKRDDFVSEVGDNPVDGTTTWNLSEGSADLALIDLNANLDEVRICKDCKVPFFMTRSEQKWFEERGWTAPVRCCACRKARKLQQQ